MLFLVFTLANLIMFCCGGENILLFHKTPKDYTITAGHQVTLRCVSKGSVTIRRVETEFYQHTMTFVNNSVLLVDNNGSYTFNSTNNGTYVTHDLTIREVTREFNDNHFWCVDLVTFDPQGLSLKKETRG